MIDKIYKISLGLFLIGKIIILIFSTSNYDNNIVYIVSLINFFLIFLSICINIFKSFNSYVVEYYTREFLLFIFTTETVIFISSSIIIVYYSEIIIEHNDSKYSLLNTINWSLWILPTFFSILLNYKLNTNNTIELPITINNEINIPQ
jgi:hypothetical protein